MSQPESTPLPIVRIDVRLKLGDDRLAASDDPLYLGLRGPVGREFRLLLARGKSLRRGREEHYVLGAPGDPATNVAHPELNDPAVPAVDAAGVSGVYLRKDMEPIPNVRAIGELDDRIQIEEAEVGLHGPASPKPVRFARRGPIWLGLGAGFCFELARLEE